MVGCGDASGPTFAGGSGTVEDPYQIANWRHLHNIRDHLSACFILMNDLDSTTLGYEELASPAAKQGKGWQPIGTEDNPFTGTFDGQIYEISDLFINRPDETHVGIFSRVDEGVRIEDIGIVNVTVTGDYYVGGLVGYSGGTMSNSHAIGSVNAGSGVGGLVGANSGSVSNSYFTGNVTGNHVVGGVVGANGGNVSNSYFTGNVTSKYGTVGGLAGENSGGVSNSYSTGSVSGSDGVGGLVGNNVDGAVNDSYSRGNVTGNWDVGGLVGYSRGTVSNSYSTGSVTGDLYVGGLVGLNHDTVTNSFWDTQTSGQATSDGGTGKTTAEMKSIATFSGATWDIAAVSNLSECNPAYIWNIINDESYPFLSWQPV